MKKLLLHIVLFFCIVQHLYAQDDGVVAFDVPTRNSLKFNKYTINPTFSFVREQNRYLSFYNKRQWTQFNDAPLTYLVSYTGRFKENMGVGVGLFQQDYGVLTTFGGVLNFAYNAALNTDSNLTFGINLGFYKSGINAGRVITNFPDPSLENIPSNSIITVNPGLNYGTAFIDFGVSVKNAVSYNLLTSQIIQDNPEQSIQAHLMYTGYVESRGFFDESKFSGLLRAELKKDQTVLSGLVMLTVPKGIWAQAGYNTLYGVSGGLGLNISKQIAIEYNYEKTIGDLSAFGNSHEITLAYKFKNKERYTYSGDDDEQALLIIKKKRNILARNSTVPKLTAEEKRIAKEEARARIKARRIAAQEKAEKRKRSAQQNQAKIESKYQQMITEEEVAQNEKMQLDPLVKADETEDKNNTIVEATRIKQAEASRIAAQQKAEADRVKIEAAKLKQAEATRLKQEEASRIAAQQKAEADRVKIEAAKLKQAEATRLKQAEASRIAAQQKAEADRAKIEAAKLKQAEATRIKQAEASRIAAQQKAEADRVKLEAAKLKQAEAARLKQEEASRIAAQQKAEADRVKLEAAKLKQAEEARLKQAEASRIAAQQKTEADRAKIAAAKLKQAEEARIKQAESVNIKTGTEPKANTEEISRIEQVDAKTNLETQKNLKENVEVKQDEESQPNNKVKKSTNLRKEEQIEMIELDGVLVPLPKDETTRYMNDLTSLSTNFKIEQQKLLLQLSETVADRNQDLKDLKEENDLSERGIYKAPKAFKSVSAENAKLESLKLEVDNIIKKQNEKISQLENLYTERLKVVKDKNDKTNMFYSEKIQDLKTEQRQVLKTRQNLLSNLETIKQATEVERKRRIKRAVYDNQEDRYLKDRAALNQIKQFTPVASEPLSVGDFDAGEQQSSSIKIIKNVKHIKSGYYLVIGVHSDIAKRDNFLRNAIAAGQSNIDFFFDVTTSKYFIYYQKFNDIQSAKNAMLLKGSKPYNNTMSMVKVEN